MLSCKNRKNSHDWDVIFIVCLDSLWLLFWLVKKYLAIGHPQVWTDLYNHVKGTLVGTKKQSKISIQNSLQYKSETIVLVSPFCVKLLTPIIAYFIQLRNQNVQTTHTWKIIEEPRDFTMVLSVITNATTIYPSAGIVSVGQQENRWLPPVLV